MAECRCICFEEATNVHNKLNPDNKLFELKETNEEIQGKTISRRKEERREAGDERRTTKRRQDDDKRSENWPKDEKFE